MTTLITILISWSISNHFIEKFYVAHTMNALRSTYESCNEFFGDKENIKALDKEEIVSLYGYVENQAGAAIYVINPDEFTVYSSVKLNQKTILALRSVLFSYDEDTFKYSDIKYRIVRNETGVQSGATQSKVMNYYDLVGILDNGFFIVLRTPMETVHDNINFAAKLFTSISLMLLVIEVLIVLLISNMFSRPIIEMSRVAKKMSNMDFSAKVDVKSQDEIGVLGESMNELSTKLEKSISGLKNANLELSNDIREREHIEEMRSEFLSHVSHELKTPLAIIQGYAEGLKSGIADDAETMNYYCNVISDEASKMNALVMRLIDLNQLETGDDISIERFDLTEMIDGEISSSAILLQDKDVTVEFEEKEPLYIWADAFMTEEVVTNYLTNAIHYVKDGGKIRIWYEKRENVTRICVFNEGDQIADKDIDKLFIKFYKSDAARTRSYGGSGIGLSIVAAIMKAHDQDFGVYNTEDGVVFYFEADTHSDIIVD
ncbi:MAG: HAMP domain-containing protein [Eubacterium sp.]|nr:HAMP domain-containing protein [Eubacterium sp.]